MRIDLPPVGPAGIEAKTWDVGSVRYLYIAGSDHWRDWVHHILPGARRREIDAAYALYSRIRSSHVVYYVVSGHSLGGAVAETLATIMRKDGHRVICVTFGGKRPPVGYSAKGVRYRHKGDVVPLLTPWRGFATHKRIGDLAVPWKAHGPDTYDTVRRDHGLE